MREQYITIDTHTHRTIEIK